MKHRKSKPPLIKKAEREQVRARRIVGHSFALSMDEHGRDRLSNGTAESARLYDLTTAGYVRVRNIDPLKGISSLSERQRGAGARYREDFEIANREGLNSGSFSEHVDGGSHYKGIPAHLLDATEALRCANGALGHPTIVGVVEGVCGLGMSISAYAVKASDPRDAVIALLRVGLDKLIDHYRPVKNGRH
jgi:hypothetical protein